MTKKLLFATIIILLVTVVLFAGCESYKNPVFSMGDNEAVVSSNGGLVVKQGNYIYFVNGYNEYDSTEAKVNWFGNVEKGAILRLKSGESMDKAEVIVPKIIQSPLDASGFSIYDDYIYYVSPSTEESKTGAVKSDILQFMRTRQDGQETRVLYESSDSSLKYKYTPYGLLYFSQGNLYCKPYNAKHFNAKEEGRILVEEATSIYFPVSDTYDSKKGETLSDYYFYTKSSEAMYDYSNKLYIANAAGTVNKLLIDKYTYTSNPSDNPGLAFKIDMLGSILEGDNLTIYYKKTEYTGTSSEGKIIGIFANQISSTLEFDKSTETKLSSFDATKILPLGYEKGMIVSDDALKVLAPNTGPLMFSGITSANVIGVREDYIYYTDDSNMLYRYKMDGRENVGEIMTDTMHTSWILPELLDNELYFFNSNKLNYLYKVDLDTYDRADEDSLVKELVGKMLAEDQKALEEEENN